MIVVRQLKKKAFILAELDGLVWQNKVIIFRVISCLVYRKIIFGSKVQALLNILEISLNNLEKSLVVEDITNFIQLVSPQQVDQFSQTKLRWKAPNGLFIHIQDIQK